MTHQNNTAMRKIFLCLLLLISFTVISHAQNPKREIREVTFSGSGYELGLQHGKLLRTEIGEIVKKMKQNTADNLKKDADQVLKEFFKYAQFTEAIEKYTPELYAEVKGIAEGSGQSFNDIMVLNLLDEFWVYIDNLENHHCSGMGIPSVNGSTSYIAQNMDIEKYTEGYQILIRLSRTTTRPEQLILTHPGCIALNGMNETGIGMCLNTLMQLSASQKGLPVAFIIRRILNTTDKKDLLNFIQTVPHASGQNYIIGIRGEVYDFEASANKVVRYDPNNLNGTVYHTNHPLVNDDVKAWFKEFSPSLNERVLNTNSHIRLAAVQTRISQRNDINDMLIKETLRSKDDAKNPVCRSVTGGGGVFTFGSVIMTLSGKPFLQITSGSPDDSAYKRVDFSNK
jgi:isopenicillin-N N-acyltransferase like protein